MRTITCLARMRSALYIGICCVPLALAAAPQDSGDKPRTEPTAKPAVAAPTTDTRIYPLKYAEATSTMQILQPILAAATRTAAPGDANSGGGGGSSRSTISIVADPRTNAIIAIGDPRSLESVEQLLAALDREVVESDKAAPQGKEKSNARRLPDVSYRLDLTVFQVSAPAAKAAALDAESLETQAKTAQTLETALQTIGTTKLLYRFDRTMTTGRPARLEATATVPVVQTEMRVHGQPQQMVNREQLGAKFEIFAEPVDEGSTRIRLNADGSISLLTQQEIPGDSPRVLAVPRRMAASFDGLTEVGHPAVLLSVDTNTAGDDPGTALVVRILVTAN